ncbi:MAG: c-type cytochrome [Burkholderiaceae bacterium]
MDARPLGRFGAALSCALIAAASAASWAAGPAAMPPAVTALRESPLPGYRVAQQKCTICHSTDYIAFQPPAMTQAQWTAEMTKMQRAYGAPISDGEVAQLGAYFAVAYGAADADDPKIVAASKAADAGPAAAPPAASAEAKNDAAGDVKGLLDANACLGCHALQQKVVGPSYHDVAAKYKDDPQASAKLEASIRSGGSGKWGPVAMPPFAALTDAQLKALAEFVLKQ